MGEPALLLFPYPSSELPFVPVARSALVLAARFSSDHQAPAFWLNARAITGSTWHPIRPEHFSPGKCEQRRGSNGYRSAPGAVTENMTESRTVRKFSSSRRRVSRAHVGANSGHVRDEHRITPSGIGRPQEQRWNRRRQPLAGVPPAPATIAALIGPPVPAGARPRSAAAHRRPRACPESCPSAEWKSVAQSGP